MSWSDSSSLLSDSSDLSNSEIEFELYSQLHYNTGEATVTVSNGDYSKEKSSTGFSKKYSGQISTAKSCTSTSSKHNGDKVPLMARHPTTAKQRTRNLSFVSVYSSDDEDWQIITSSSESEDSDVCLRAEESNDIWKVSSIDHEMMNQRIVRYYNKPKTRCHRCNALGHMSYECSQPRKVQRCCLCANRGHHPQACKGSVFLGPCYKESRKCKRCNQVGHSKKHCPDIWRQFHMTVNPGRICTSHREVDKKACYYCFQSDHLPYECDQRWKQENQNFLAPIVAKYDSKIKVKKVINSIARATRGPTIDTNDISPTEDTNCNDTKSTKDVSTATTKRKKKVNKKPEPVKDIQLSFKSFETKLQRLNSKRKNKAVEKNAKRLKLEKKCLKDGKLDKATTSQVEEVDEPFQLPENNKDCTVLQEILSDVLKPTNFLTKEVENLKNQSLSVNDVATKDPSTCDENILALNRTAIPSNNLFCNSKSEKRKRKIFNLKKKKNVAGKVRIFSEEDYLETPFPRKDTSAMSKGKASPKSLLAACVGVTVKDQNLSSEICPSYNQSQEMSLPCA